MTENNEQGLTTIDDVVPVAKMKSQMKLIQEYMKSVLIKGEHYGEIPGCGNKPTLLKSGAEKLCFAFHLRHDFEVTILDDPDSDHRSVRVHCRIFNKGTGLEVGQGLGEASTKETKWRYRSGVSELTSFSVPPEYWEDRDINILRGVDPSLKTDPLSTAKNDDGEWFISIKGTKVEHDNPADYYNTVLKMAKKRAMVDATITTTACSDIFTQDIEDLKDNEPPAQADSTKQEPAAIDTSKTTSKPEQSTPSTREASVPPSSSANGNGAKKVTKSQAGLVWHKFTEAGFSQSDIEAYCQLHYQAKDNHDLPMASVKVILALFDKGELRPMVSA